MSQARLGDAEEPALSAAVHALTERETIDLRARMRSQGRQSATSLDALGEQLWQPGGRIRAAVRRWS